MNLETVVYIYTYNVVGSFWLQFHYDPASEVYRLMMMMK